MEMNIHLPQSIQARNELKRIANVKYQILGAKDSNPIIGCQQDALSGAFLLSQKDIKLKGSDVANILCNTSSETKDNIEMNKEYTGHEIFTHIIPKGINNTKKNDKGDITFQIKDGQLLTGLLDKSSLSTAKNSIIHFIWDKYGPDKTRRFIDDSQKLVLNFLLQRGMTISFADAFLDKDFEEKMKKLLDNTVLENKYKLTQYENDVDQISYQIIEEDLYSHMNATGSDVGGTIKKHLNVSNFFWALVSSGAKGSETNLQQMMACIGQQALEGKRILKKVERRSLVYFHKDDDTPEARGFTRSSLLDGLKGYEAFIFSAAGREGLIDTAIKSVTWETPIVIIENNQPKYTEIGKWIDSRLDAEKDLVKHYKDRDMELLDTRDIFIPTMNEQGQVTWGEVTAVTRHDPGKELYEIKTYGGRKVIVTESKSLLIWKDDKKVFEEILTPEIKIGDFLPVTAELTQPPVIKDFVDMNKYFSKSEYIYGTEFNKTKNLVNSALKGRKQLPYGWWEENNGKEFILPYSNRYYFNRALKRSNITNIKDNYIYPFHSNRDEILIPDRFKLDYKNGIFIGLFLAEGHATEKIVQITKQNKEIQDFVKGWFDEYHIKHYEVKSRNENELPETIAGCSTILAEFLHKFVGHLSHNKFVPDEAHIANNDFIKGLINGYFSGDGYIGENCIEILSVSEKLINGINMLCTRLGIFGKISNTISKSGDKTKPAFRFRINSKWAKIFSDKIELINKSKNDKLKMIKTSESHSKFKEINNVVLDPIVEINILGIEKYKKVYDLTIPSTLNFGLANGLQVRDTAQTGYIKRKLIKGLEDLSIRYDGTNRNSKGVIIQYVYGENGINQAAQTDIKLSLLGMDNKKLEETFCFSEDQMKKLEKKHKMSMKELKSFNDKYLERMKLYRDELRVIQMKVSLNYMIMEEKYMLPVNLFRLTQDYSHKSENIELTPQDIINSIEEFLDSPETKLLPGANKGDNRLRVDDRSLKYLLEIALYEYLSPNKCLFEYGLTKSDLTKLWKEIKMAFIKALVEPGEMVGVLAAQSIGEPTTQLNLNTKHFAGVASKSGASSGVPRIIELISLSKDIKTPQMVVHFNPDIRSDRHAVNKIAS